MKTHFKKFSWNQHIESISTAAFANTFQVVCNSAKLQAITERQIANNQKITMRNRVNKLRKDKELAEWEIAEAKKKTKFAMKEIARKNREANEKLSLFQEKKEIEEELRKNCQREQEERKRNIKNFEERIIKQNKLYALRKKREGLEWDQLRNSNKLSDLEQKQAKCKSIDNSYAESLRQRCLSQRSQRSNFKDDYFNSIDSERKKTKKAYKTISKLEKLEEKLIEKLSKTLETRNIIIENLSKIKS